MSGLKIIIPETISIVVMDYSASTVTHYNNVPFGIPFDEQEEFIEKFVEDKGHRMCDCSFMSGEEITFIEE